MLTFQLSHAGRTIPLKPSSELEFLPEFGCIRIHAKPVSPFGSLDGEEPIMFGPEDGEMVSVILMAYETDKSGNETFVLDWVREEL